MTKKDYIKAAEIVVEHGKLKNLYAKRAMTDAFITLFQDDNPRFDRVRFLSACGFDS